MSIIFRYRTCFTTSQLLLLLVLLGFSFPASSLAEGETYPAKAATVVAATEIQDALFERQDGNVFTIGFTLTNTKDVQTDVSYAISVF